jgi:GNAT superfamily N-acetyltransferase
MIVRTSKPTDKPAIIELLKLSLGEGLIKKSTTVWNFKHEENPFGESYVLLAFEGDLLIGVRALMQWRWQIGTTLWTAYRAVDTATHPDHQGKGIFKKLTLQALDEVAQQGDSFVFNTPNNQSRPGYLKMGWQIVDAIPIAVIPTLAYVFHFLFSKKKILSNSISTSRLEEICNHHNHVLSKKNSIFTPKSAAYLRWRYEDNPMQDYTIISEGDWYVALYIKKHRFFNEIRVVETISANPKTDFAFIKKAILQYAFSNKGWLITAANKKIFGWCLFGKFGPKLTFKPLTQEASFNNKALDISVWEYSLGDLELF